MMAKGLKCATASKPLALWLVYKQISRIIDVNYESALQK